MSRIDSSYGWLVAPEPALRARLADEADRVYLARAHGSGPLDGRRGLAELEAEVMVDRYLSGPQPLYSRLPFDYRLVPSPIRAAGLIVLERMHRDRDVEPFPRWPQEWRLDDLRATVWSDAASRLAERLEAPIYPDGHRGAVLLTHDIDSRADIEGVAALRTLERECGLPSSFGFIPRISWPDRRVVDALIDDGCEIYCHDIRHDAKLPYQQLDAMRAAFERFFDANEYARSLLRGFRSGQLLMTPGLLALVGTLFSYDLSLPDSEHGGPYGAHAGCATVHPFLVDGLLEIPLTLPQDFYLENVERYDGQQALSLWRRKLDAVLTRGGVAVLNTHPVWTNPRRPDMWAAYLGLIQTIASADAWVTTPSSLYRWLLDRRAGMTGDGRAAPERRGGTSATDDIPDV